MTRPPEHRRIRPPNPLERHMSKYMREPPTVRSAAAVIVTATVVVVVIGGVLIRVLDHEEYSNVWLGMWWAMQTVTTVGYGDVTPKDVAGRIVGAFVMLEGVAFVAIITAVITSSFVARAERELEDAGKAADGATESRYERRFDSLDARLDRIERLLEQPGRG